MESVYYAWQSCRVCCLLLNNGFHPQCLHFTLEIRMEHVVRSNIRTYLYGSKLNNTSNVQNHWVGEHQKGWEIEIETSSIRRIIAEWIPVCIQPRSKMLEIYWNLEIKSRRLNEYNKLKACYIKKWLVIS